MTQRHPVGVRFLHASEGGRSSFPTGPIYVGVATIASSTRHWTVMLRFFDEPDARGVVMGTVELIASTAPPKSLHEGAELRVYEGQKLVGIGKVLAHPA